MDSPKARVVRIFSTPVMLMQPLTISSPPVTSRGRLSPVRAAVFRVEVPSSTTPSRGTFSPGWTTMVAPTGTSSGSTWVNCIVRANVHQGGDAATALAHGVALEQLADLIEQHHGHGLHEVAAFLVKRQADGAHGGHGHQEVLVEHLAPEDALAGLAENVIADDQVRRQIQQRPGQASDGKQPDGQDQHRRDDDAAEHLFLLLGHASSPPSADVPEWLPARVVFHR